MVTVEDNPGTRQLQSTKLIKLSGHTGFWHKTYSTLVISNDQFMTQMVVNGSSSTNGNNSEFMMLSFAVVEDGDGAEKGQSGQPQTH
jgi:hypothetical protein